MRGLKSAAAWLFACAVVGTAAAVGAASAAAETTLPILRDARGEAAVAIKARQPLVILFSMPGCTYCPEVRNNYLMPMVREATAKPGTLPVVREVDITSHESLKDFDGKPMEAAEFSRRYKVKATPTVVFLDERGQQLAQALVGSGMAGFYGAYLESALDTARQTLKTARP
jgi:thioredoxin-related protein